MRRVFQIALGLILIALLAAALLPWWFGFVLKPLAQRQGVTFSRYERLGYGQFRLHDLEFQRGNVRIEATSLEGPQLFRWLSPALRQAKIGAWKIDISPKAPGPRTGGRVRSLPALHELLGSVASRLERWLPAAELGSGEIRWPGQALQLSGATWRNRTLTVQELGWRELVADTVISWPAQGPATIGLKSDEWDAELRWAGAAVEGSGHLWEQPLGIQAKFPTERWTPDSAGLTASNWELPANRVRLGAHYNALRGSSQVAWTSDHFVVATELAATPREDAKSAPPFSVRIEARGDTKTATISALHVSAPFANADLSEPVTLDYARGFLSGNARLTVVADLARQPWVEAQGKLEGAVNVGGDGRQEFEFVGSGLRWKDLAFSRVTARGKLEWPRLTVATLDLSPDAENSVTANGEIDLVQREVVEGSLTARLAPAWFARWLPADSTWNRIELAATFSGPLANLTHAGNAKIAQAKVGRFRPLDVAIDWTGRDRRLEEFRFRATTGRAELAASGAVDAQRLQLQTLALAAPDRPTWLLARPVMVEFGPTWRVEGFRFGHDAGFLAVTARGGPASELQVDAVNLESALADDWVPIPGPRWRIRTFHLDGAFADRGVLAFNTLLEGRIELPRDQADVRLRARGDGKGVELEELSTVFDERVVTSATGHVPIAWETAPTARLRVDWDQPFAIEARTQPESPLWALLGDLAGIQFEAPTADIKLGGTLDEPKGEMRIKASRLVATAGKFKDRIPDVTNLTFTARADRSLLSIDGLAVQVDDQKLNARGRLAMGGRAWQSLRDDPLAYIWEHGEGRIELVDADLARLARRLPNLLAAQGRLDAHFDLATGSLAGEVHLKGAALRPLDPIGVVHEINADLALKDRTLEITTWSAKVGGEPVELRGTIELPPEGSPRVDLQLAGTNLPLVRRPGLIVRSDLALAAKTSAKGVTQVTGTVTLHDSVVLAEMSGLLRGGPNTTRKPPPYFSVDRPPFNDWTLAVDLRGTRAIKIRTPVVTGVTSARFRLGGTLGDPRAVGELTVDEGRVLFPFAAFEVQYGAVRLSEADPHRPQVQLNAESSYHDYLLRLEATGPLDAPQVQLSSTPSLDAADLLLLVTSGQSPESDRAAATGSQRLARLGTYIGQGLILGSGGEGGRVEFSSGSQVSDEGRETYEFTYRLDDRWSLVGEYDQFDEYNAGIKWRAYVQEGDAPKKK